VNLRPRSQRGALVNTESRIIVVDPTDATRDLVTRRLRAQGYLVEDTGDPATGANMALCSPPSAVVADLWMPSISGVQICRLLRSEPATAEVPVILCGDTDEPRNRFWADRAGANAYVPKHRTGELVRALHRAVIPSTNPDVVFQSGVGTIDVRDRIARHLDEALFDSVIAAEVRALAACGAFERLFDLFAQFLSQVSRYRWLAVTTNNPARLAVHHHPRMSAEADEEACLALGLPRPTAAWRADVFRIEDEDAIAAPLVSDPIVRNISLGNSLVGRVVLSPCSAADVEPATRLLSLVARELGSPLRMTALIEESQRLAATDSLTRLTNRRAFSAAVSLEISRAHRHAYPLSLILLDIDLFKKINDTRGHSAGDRVLAALGNLLGSSLLRRTDLAARWGGEEFVVAYLSTPADGALIAAERLRAAIEALIIEDDEQLLIPVTASIGLAELRPDETLEQLVARADRAMYLAKSAGRNRVQVSEPRPDGTFSGLPSVVPSVAPSVMPSFAPVPRPPTMRASVLLSELRRDGVSLPPLLSPGAGPVVPSLPRSAASDSLAPTLPRPPASE
jgi:two-component system cell cycle response regulator